MTVKVHFAKGSSSIPLVEFAGIYDRLTGIFGENTVVIGGRAVNLLCYNNRRDTHDIDVVIEPRANPETKVGIILGSGFSIIRDKHNKIKTLVDDATGVSVDLYWKRDVGGIRIEDIIETSVSKDEAIGGRVYRLKVAAPLALILMKHSAWNTDRRGAGPRGGKDADDIRALIQNQYGTPANFFRSDREELLGFFQSSDTFDRFVADIEIVFSAPLAR